MAEVIEKSAEMSGQYIQALNANSVVLREAQDELKLIQIRREREKIT